MIVVNSGQRGYIPNIFLRQMEFSKKFDIVKSGGSTDYIERLKVIISALCGITSRLSLFVKVPV